MTQEESLIYNVIYRFIRFRKYDNRMFSILCVLFVNVSHCIIRYFVSNSSTSLLHNLISTSNDEKIITLIRKHLLFR